MNKRFTEMTTQPVSRLLVKMSVPTIITMLISAMYNMADTYFVGSIGTTATAAVGVSFSLMAIIQAVGFFFGQGAGNFISRELGAQRTENAARMAATGLVMSFLVTAAVAIAGLILLEPLAMMLGSTPTILPHAREYLTFVLIGAPWMASAFTLNTILRFQGSAFYGMIGMASGAFLNIVLDPIFIFVLDMGVSGAALATMISQIASFLLLLAGSRSGNNIRIRIRNFSPTRSTFREIVRGGTPSLCRQSIASVAAISLNRMAGQFGDEAIAAMSIVQRVSMLANAAVLGWGQGFQPICGFNFGAGLYRRVKSAFRFCVKTACLTQCVLAAIAFVYAPEIVELFRKDDAAVIAIGSLALRFQCLTFPTTGWVVPNNMMLQNIGRPGYATLIALARQGLFLLSFLFILTPAYGLPGVQLAQPLADIATVILTIPISLSAMRSMPDDDVPIVRLMEKPNAEFVNDMLD
jgi:putative efflux protein, MATE family